MADSNTIVFAEAVDGPAVSAAAALLRGARRQARLSQAELAKRAGVPASMVSAYERDLRQPSLVTLTRLVRAAGLELRVQLVLAEQVVLGDPEERPWVRPVVVEERPARAASA